MQYGNKGFLFLISLFTSFSIMSTSAYTEISIGELVDKLTILEIKKERIHDAMKLHNITTEFDTLNETLNEILNQHNIPLKSNSSLQNHQLIQLKEELLEVNKQLWDIEDQIRIKEREKCFDAEFIDLARRVYMVNDQRAELKRAINFLLHSRLVEEKSYTSYK